MKWERSNHSSILHSLAYLLPAGLRLLASFRLPYQFPIQLADRLGNNPHFTDDGHEIDIARPAGNDVLVQMARHTRAGAAAEVYAEVKSLS